MLGEKQLFRRKADALGIIGQSGRFREQTLIVSGKDFLTQFLFALSSKSFKYKARVLQCSPRFPPSPVA